MGSKTNRSQFSVGISDFCNMVVEAKKNYEWNYAEVNKLDRLTQDYLHKLELEGLGYKERAKVATKLAQCRRLRREAKDVTEILEPLVELFESDRGRAMLNQLRETLGKTRKVEERMGNRTYVYKVLGGEENE